MITLKEALERLLEREHLSEAEASATLRALRAAAWGLTSSKTSTTEALADASCTVASRVPPGALVIDLTD